MITGLKINEEAKKRYYQAGYWTSDTIVDAWRAAARAVPDKVFVSDDQGGSLTYRACDEMSDRVGAWLVRAGVKPGDVVTFQLPTWAEFCPVFLGVLKAGAVMHPVARNYSRCDLAYVMEKVGSIALICPTFHHTTDHEAQALEVAREVPTLDASRILLVQKNARAPMSGLPTLEDVVADASLALPDPAPHASSDEVACILSTSGTTGKPKQALLTHNNILFSERAFLSGLARTADDVMFMPSPLNHATGFFHGLIAPMLLRGSTVLQQDFDADAAIELVNAVGATWSMGATPFIFDILHSMVEHGTSTPPLKLFLSGGAPLPSELVACAHVHGIRLCECYGSTESCPHVYVPPEQCLAWRGKWSGTALPGIEIRIVDGAHKTLPAGVQGEEASRGPHVFVGYLNDAEVTDAVLDDDGWFYSGDLGVMDEQGRLHITGRKKDIIVRGGENISTREVEEAVRSWPDIVDAAAVGAPDARMGERICLFAVAKPGLDHELCLKSLTAHLAEQGTSKRLWPERLERIDAIPRTATGKVRRFLLAQELKKRMGAGAEHGE